MPELTREFTGLLFEEAERQLRICNACRYCDGYCAVFTSLGRRPLLTTGDMAHLAHLCHDCRSCLYACMYAPPHSFAVNPPQLFSELRRATYDRQRSIFTRRLPPALRGWRGAAPVTLLAATLLLGAALLSTGVRSLPDDPGTPASPHSAIPYTAAVILAVIASACSVLTMVLMARRYWAEIHASTERRIGLHALFRTVTDAGRLRYLKGGEGGCAYPDRKVAQTRRRLHAATLYGFAALLLSTAAASIAQHVLGPRLPYPIASVPVGFGITGGASVVLGCTGMIILRMRADPVVSDAGGIARGYGLLITLDLLAITGLLTLTLRNTPLYAIVLTAHLSLVVASIAAAPYSKLLHAAYRFLSILEDHAERAAQGA